MIFFFCYRRHYLEDIVFQQVAERIARDSHNNITVAVRHASKPYIIFKNDTDLNFSGASGKVSNVGYTISNTAISGFANTEQKVKKVTVKMTTNTVTVDLRITIHNLDGKFDFKIEESKPITGKATLTIGRIDGSVSYNLLKPTECKADVVLNQPNFKYGTKISADIEKTLSNAFVDNVKNQLNTVICKTYGQAIKSGK